MHRQIQALLISLVMGLGVAHTATAEVGDTFEARLAALDVMSGLLQYHNPSYTSVSLQRRYQRSLDSLEAWAKSAQLDPDVQGKVQDFINSVKALEGQSSVFIDDDMRAHWLNKVSQVQADLDRGLERTEMPAPSRLEAEVRTLALTLAMQNVAYQAAPHNDVTVKLMGGRPDVMSVLDTSFTESILHLQELLGEDRVLQKLVSRYNFIRPRLIGEQDSWFPPVVAFYSFSMRILLTKLQSPSAAASHATLTVEGARAS